MSTFVPSESDIRDFERFRGILEQWDSAACRNDPEACGDRSEAESEIFHVERKTPFETNEAGQPEFPEVVRMRALLFLFRNRQEDLAEIPALAENFPGEAARALASLDDHYAEADGASLVLQFFVQAGTNGGVWPFVQAAAEEYFSRFAVREDFPKELAKIPGLRDDWMQKRYAFAKRLQAKLLREYVAEKACAAREKARAFAERKTPLLGKRRHEEELERLEERVKTLSRLEASLGELLANPARIGLLARRKRFFEGGWEPEPWDASVLGCKGWYLF